MEETAEFEVWQDGRMVAGSIGPREDALREAINYVSQYGQDGPVEVFQVNRTKVHYVTVATDALNKQELN